MSAAKKIVTDTPTRPGPGSQTAHWLGRMGRVVPSAVAGRAPMLVARAEGAHVWDIEGREFIDLVGGVGCLNVGHSHPRVVAAIQRQAARFTHTDFALLPYETYITLAERLIATVPGPSAKQAAFFNSGAEAVENAVKIVRIATGRPGVIAFEGAFHGRTYMALSLTSKIDPYKRGMGPFMPEVYRVPYPDPYRLGSNALEFVLESINRMFVATVDARQVAAIIVEPILGEGGFVVPPPGFLPALRALCDQHGILLIADEIQTGMGRTGKMWATDHSGIEPDLMVIGKSIAAGLPLSGVIGRRQLFDRIPINAIGGTFVGNPVACAAALAVLDIIRDEDLVARASRLGTLIRDQLTSMAERHALIGHVRGMGAMMAIELVKNRQTKQPASEETTAVIEEAFAGGVLLFRAGLYGNVIRMLTPLVISETDLEHALSILAGALATVQQSIR